MNTLIPPKYGFDQEIENKYVEWMFERTRSFLIAIGLIAIAFIVFFIVRDSCSPEHAENMVNLCTLRLVMVIAIFAAIVSFFRSSACQAQKNLFWVLIIIIFLAIYDTYLTVGVVGELNTAAEMFSIYMFMIVPFITVKHKFYIGLLYILGMLACSLALGIYDINWTLAYVLVIYCTALLIYHKVDFLFRTQFMSILEEKEKACIDTLTGAYNRKSLYSSFKKDLSMVDQNSKMLVGVLDIDCFKLYNDTYGHLAGDKVLRKISRVLLSIGFDKVFRFGGEEFVFTWKIPCSTDFNLPDICSLFESYNIPHKSSTVASNVTASTGIIIIDYEVINNNIIDNPFVDLIIMKADNNLYKAKHGGRNNTVISEDLDL